MSESKLSRGARRLLDRFIYHGRKSGRIQLDQKRLSKALGGVRRVKRDGKYGFVRADVSDRTVREYLAELRACTDRCPVHCDGDPAHGHVGLVEVEQSGDGYPASYYLTAAVPSELTSGLLPGCFRAEIEVESSQASPNTEVAEKNFRAEIPLPVVVKTVLQDQQHCSPVVGSSPAANDAAAANPSPEAKKAKPKPGSAGTPFDGEVAEIRAALKARPLVRYNPAFDPVIREMLASGETVETIKRAILQACWLKLAGRDRAAGMGVADTSLIYSMRYFADVIPDVKSKSDPVYWRNLALRLPREEQARLGQQLDVA